MNSPEEIKKAIWKCLPENKELCDMCPYNDYGENEMHPCWETRIKDTIAYIQQLEREKEELVKNKLLSEGTTLDLREVAKVCEGELLVAAINMISDMQAAAPKWISVEERLPERHGQACVGMYSQHGDDKPYPFPHVFTWHAYGDNGYVNGPHFSDEGLDGLKVHYWMPLPEAPKEEE